MFKMEEETVTLPKPPDGYDYKLVSTKKKPRIKDKDPSELTPRQFATRKYYEKNRQKIRRGEGMRGFLHFSKLKKKYLKILCLYKSFLFRK